MIAARACSESVARFAMSSLVIAIAACHHRADSWVALSRSKGCTPELLASTPSFDSARAVTLAGSYRLVQIDTARGWTELSRKWGYFGHEDTLTLAVADSAHRYWRWSDFRQANFKTDRPIV